MLIPAIPSGDAGTRLWSVSCEGQPKPSMRLPGGQTLLDKTYRRTAGLLTGHGEIVTVTNREHYFQNRDQFQVARPRRRRGHFILEPTGCNAAPTIAVATLALQAGHGDTAVLVVMSAGHLVHNEEAFRKAAGHVARLAVAGHLVTFGMVPDAAETGFGYIELGDRLDEQGTVKVCRFVGKPDEGTACRYMKSGGFLQNSGIFCFTTSTLVNELAQHVPALLEQARAYLTASTAVKMADDVQHGLAGEAFAALPDISIGYVLVERSARVAVVPAAFDWSDISS